MSFAEQVLPFPNILHPFETNSCHWSIFYWIFSVTLHPFQNEYYRLTFYFVKFLISSALFEINIFIDIYCPKFFPPFPKRVLLLVNFGLFYPFSHSSSLPKGFLLLIEFLFGSVGTYHENLFFFFMYPITALLCPS